MDENPITESFEITDGQVFEETLRPFFEGNLSESSAKYKSLSGNKFLPSEEQLVGRYLDNKIRGLSDHEMDEYIINHIDFNLLDPSKLPNALDDGGIYCFTNLKKFKKEKRNFKRETLKGQWKKYISDRPVFGEDGKVKLGTRTLLYYCDKNKRKTKWLMRQYTLDRSQWPEGKEEECKKLALCHIYRSKRKLRVDNESSSISIAESSHNADAASLSNPKIISQNYPVPNPQTFQSGSSILLSSIHEGRQIGANNQLSIYCNAIGNLPNFDSPFSADFSNLYQNQDHGENYNPNFFIPTMSTQKYSFEYVVPNSNVPPSLNFNSYEPGNHDHNSNTSLNPAQPITEVQTWSGLCPNPKQNSDQNLGPNSNVLPSLCYDSYGPNTNTSLNPAPPLTESPTRSCFCPNDLWQA